MEQLYLFRVSNLYKCSSDGQFHLIISFSFTVCLLVVGWRHIILCQ